MRMRTLVAPWLAGCCCPMMMTNGFFIRTTTTILPSSTADTAAATLGGHFSNMTPRGDFQQQQQQQHQRRSSMSRSHWICGTRTNSNDFDKDNKDNDDHSILFPKNSKTTATTTRRSFFRSTAAVVGATTSYLGVAPAPEAANARGLVEFPCNRKPLLNHYYLMRAGTTLLEEQDILSTNPLFLTNREAALSEVGIAQVQEASRFLAQNNINPSVVKYSLAAAAMDTAQLVKDSELQVGQNRLIPEFTFMDPRAIGKWDMMSLSQTQPALFAMDAAQAGVDGKDGRPPPNDDGTPHETLADQAIRLRQLMSVLETQFSGDTILLVFPDGSSPALLSAMIGGIPYNRVHELEFQPGEVRLDITYQSVRSYFEQLEQDKEKVAQYQATLQQGQAEWDRLKSTNVDDLVSKKDQNIEKERIEIDTQYQQEQEDREARQVAERQAREGRLAELEAERQSKRQQQHKQPGDGGSASLPLGVIGGVAAAGTIGLAAVLGGGNENEGEKDNGRVTNNIDPQGSSPLTDTDLESSTSAATSESKSSLSNDLLGGTIAAARTSPISSSAGASAPLFDSLPDQAPPPRPISEEDRQAAAQQAMQEYLNQDDGGEAWLQVMSDLAQAEDGDDNILLDEDNNDIRAADGIATFEKIDGSTDMSSTPLTLSSDETKDITVNFEDEATATNLPTTTGTTTNVMVKISENEDDDEESIALKAQQLNGSKNIDDDIKLLEQNMISENRETKDNQEEKKEDFIPVASRPDDEMENGGNIRNTADNKLSNKKNTIPPPESNNDDTLS